MTVEELQAKRDAVLAQIEVAQAYQASGGAYYPDDISADECPVSLLSIGDGAAARKVAESAMCAGLVKSASGAALGGPDSGDWPVWWFDATAIIEQQRIAEHNARIEFENEQAKR